MSPFIAKALADASITINTNIPGPSAPATGIGGFITNFYSFALMMAGILAFGAIVYGGIKYAVGKGNPSSETEGKSWITNALLGLLLLAGAYVILFTINPQIVTLNIPGLPQLAAPTAGGGAGGGGAGGGGAGGAGGGGTGQPGPRCQAPSSGGCSVANLTAHGGSCFGSNITLAAGVCNVESANGAFVYSTTDKCDDGHPVSIGLFQINISANTIAGLNCPSAFSNPFTGSNPHCTVTSSTLYNQCVNAAADAGNNIAKACALSSGGTNFRLWGAATRNACGL